MGILQQTREALMDTARYQNGYTDGAMAARQNGFRIAPAGRQAYTEGWRRGYDDTRVFIQMVGKLD